MANLMADDTSSRNLLAQMDDLVASLRMHIDELKDEITSTDPSERTPTADKLLNARLLGESS